MGSASDQHIRPLTDEECDAVMGGLISATFQYGSTKIEISGWRDGYMVCTFGEGAGTCTIVETNPTPL